MKPITDLSITTRFPNGVYMVGMTVGDRRVEVAVQKDGTARAHCRICHRSFPNNTACRHIMAAIRFVNEVQ